MKPNDRRLYNKPLRTQAMIEIRRLLVDGYSYDQIMCDLHIPRRTFSRYLNLLFEEDKKQLNQLNQSEVIHQFSVLIERLNTQYRESEQLAKDSSINGMARVKARHLASELAAGIFRLYTGDTSPAQMAAELPVDNNHQQQQPQQQSQQKEIPPPPPFLSEDDGIEEEDEEKDDEKDNSSQSGSFGQTEKPDNTVKPVETEPKVCDSNDMPEVQRINGLRVIRAPLEDLRKYDAQQIEDGYCIRCLDSGEKVRIDLSDIKAMKEKVRREDKDDPTTKTDAERLAKWTRYYYQ